MRPVSPIEEWHTSANLLNQEIAQIARLMPPKQFDMRVKTATPARVGAKWLVLTTGIVGTIVCGALAPHDPDAVAGLWGVGLFVLVIMVVVAHHYEWKVPVWRNASIHVAVVDGKLRTWDPGCGRWIDRTCTDLMDGEGVNPASLFAELNRGIRAATTRHNEIDVAREMATRIKELALEQASARAEIEAVIQDRRRPT